MRKEKERENTLALDLGLQNNRTDFIIERWQCGSPFGITY